VLPVNPTPAPAPVPAPPPVVQVPVVFRTQPAIFSDDVILNGGGIEFHPEGSHLRLRAEANMAYNFFAADRGRTWEPDYRVVLGYDREWERAMMFGLLQRDSFFSELEGSAGFYSRYGNNAIGYVQIREGYRINQNPSLRIGPYVTARLVKDTNWDYYNNVAEFGGGLEIKPMRDFNVSMRTEYLYGHYFGTPEQVNPFDPAYHTLRLTFRFGYRATPGE
jgi:hypothetical protein